MPVYNPLMTTALTIAGSDPSGGAGIQTDLKVFHSLGIHGLSVITSITAQNSRGFSGIMPVTREFVRKQLAVLLSDIRPDSVKTGMLYSRSHIEVTAEIIRKYRLKNIVVDPVTVSTSGSRLARRGAIAAIKKYLLPLCDVVTPNIHEAALLTGFPVRDKDDMEKAAIALNRLGPRSVIITGGHLEKNALDILYDGAFRYRTSRKVRGQFHGTGCTFSALMAALLAQGFTVSEAFAQTKKIVTRAIRRSFSPGRGMHFLDI